MLMILVSNRLTLAHKTSYESRTWRAQNEGEAREPGAGASKRTKSAEIPFNRENRKKGRSSATNSALFYNFSQHPSISSASLQALCYTAGSDEYHLNDLRERLRIASPYPDNFRDTVQDWNSHESSSFS